MNCWEDGVICELAYTRHYEVTAEWKSQALQSSQSHDLVTLKGDVKRWCSCQSSFPVSSIVLCYGLISWNMLCSLCTALPSFCTFGLWSALGWAQTPVSTVILSFSLNADFILWPLFHLSICVFLMFLLYVKPLRAGIVLFHYGPTITHHVSHLACLQAN